MGNKNIFLNIAKILKELNGVEGKVGWFENSLYPANEQNKQSMPVAMIAMQNEYGGRAIHGAVVPARPTIRPASQQTLNIVKNIVKKNSVNVILNKMTCRALMKNIVKVVEQQTYYNIATIQSPRLSAETIQKRMEARDNKDIFNATNSKRLRKVKNKMRQMQIIKQDDITKPLIDTGLEITSLTSKVENV